MPGGRSHCACDARAAQPTNSYPHHTVPRVRLVRSSIGTGGCSTTSTDAPETSEVLYYVGADGPGASAPSGRRRSSGATSLLYTVVEALRRACSAGRERGCGSGGGFGGVARRRRPVRVGGLGAWASGAARAGRSWRAFRFGLVLARTRSVSCVFCPEPCSGMCVSTSVSICHYVKVSIVCP